MRRLHLRHPQSLGRLAAAALAALALLAAAPAAPAAPAARQPVKLTYLGNAGWQIEDGRTVILVDPYLSQFSDPRASAASSFDDTDDDESFDYAGRLMRALGLPAVVLPTHWDSWISATAEKAHQNALEFAAEITAASPATRVIVPAYFEPVTLP